MEPAPVHTLNFSGVLSTSKRIIITNYTHFITLSFFFLPLSFSLITTPTLRLPENHPFSGDLQNHQKLLISYLLLILIIQILSLCATSTITYTTHHVFSGEPVTISDSVKSLTASFFPLAFTAIVSYALTILISLFYFIFVGIVLMLIHNLCNFVIVIDHNSTHFMSFLVITGVILIAIIIHFHVEWSLAYAVVVVESKWGFEALTRSAYLVKGMRSISLLVMLYFWFFGAAFVSVCDVPNTWMFVLIKTFVTYFLMMLLVRLTAANTVLYNYCKALHGELAITVATGFGHDYVNLASDDAKAPHVVYVATV